MEPALASAGRAAEGPAGHTPEGAVTGLAAQSWALHASMPPRHNLGDKRMRDSVGHRRSPEQAFPVHFGRPV